MEDIKYAFKGGDYRVNYFPELESTNDAAHDSAFRHGDVIVAGNQTRGRGQRGNHWHSRPGQNLTFSLVVEPTFLHVTRQFMLSQVVSLAVVDTLAGYGIGSRVKWPNDIYVGDRKIAGILIEVSVSGESLTRGVIGIGLNVNQTDFENWVPNPVSMAGCKGEPFDLQHVLGAFLNRFDEGYSRLAACWADEIVIRYNELLYRAGQWADYARADGVRFRAAIREVRPDGVLVMELEDGTVEEFLFKEIEFII